MNPAPTLGFLLHDVARLLRKRFEQRAKGLGLTRSQWQTLAYLASNEGIYVDMKEFKINKGVAKGDPQAQIAKSGAREVSDGAIIFRSGDKLYIVDSRPPQ